MGNLANGKEALQYFSEGRIYFDNGNYEAAAISFQAARQRDPSIENVDSELGLTLLVLKRYDEALSVLEEALEQDTGNPELFKLVSNAYYLKDLNPLAAITLERGLVLYPRDAEMHYRLGIIRGHMECHEQAYKSLQTALRMQAHLTKSQLAEIHYSIGVILYGWRHYSKALDHFTKAEELLPETGDNLIYLFNTTFLLKRRDTYRAVYATLLREHPDLLDMQPNVQ